MFSMNPSSNCLVFSSRAADVIQPLQVRLPLWRSTLARFVILPQLLTRC